jgi:hypothetical protein
MFRIGAVALMIFVLAQPVLGQDFEIQAVSEDLQEALILDKATGGLIRATRGEVIQGWRIARVYRDRVTISQQTGEGTFAVTDLPVMGSEKSGIQMPK